MATRILVVDDSPTIRTVVSTILERHGYEPQVAIDGQDAFDALSSGEVKVDLVLVDFVMPRLNGFQFCRALRGNAELAATPVVLMSAKADRIRDQFVQQTGALDAITKPFEPQALVAVIENALRRANQGRSSAILPDLEFDESTGTETVVAKMPVVERETSRTDLAQMIAQKLAEVVTKTLSELPEVVSPEAVTRAIATRLESEAVLEMMGAVHKRSEAILAGDLGVVPIGAVLQLLQDERQTGVLVCRSGTAEVRATFREGVIDLVESTGAGAEFRIGRFFVEEGILTAAEIDAITQGGGKPEVNLQKTAEMPVASAPEGATLPGGDVIGALAESTRKPKPLGMTLLAKGKIVESQLRAALVQQSNELLYEVLRWRSGRFELRHEPPSELAENAKLAMPVASAVMEGFRRVDEWRVLERILGSFDTVLLRDDAAFGSLDIASLPPKEKAVLDAVDGERTLRAIIGASNLSSFDGCRICAQFLEARVLRRRTS